MSGGDPLAERDARLERFAQELARWGARMNLVGSTEPGDIRVHIQDGLAAAPHLPPGTRVVDLGSGAGFPGMPIAIARPDLTVTLVEARERRVHFLRHAVRLLELGTVVRCERFERSAPASFDVACLRAVGPLPEVLHSAAGWLGASGELWLWTRLAPEQAPFPVCGSVELGDRGRILRMTPPGLPASGA